MSARQGKVQMLASSRELSTSRCLCLRRPKVEAPWGRTGNVNCIRDDQLHDYIVQKNFGDKLDVKEVERIAQAFLAMANMDKSFDPIRR